MSLLFFQPRLVAWGLLVASLLLVFTRCGAPQAPAPINVPVLESTIPTPVLDLRAANQLAELPLACLTLEYPNKLNDVLGSDADLAPPRQLHPAFYGCFDWHSAVHAHWSLVALLRAFPDLARAADIRRQLAARLTPTHIAAEVAYFNGPHNQSFERTYGWAWALKLAEELHRWDDPLARTLEQNLAPLTDLLLRRYQDFLPKLVYPIRSGEHPNTAFGLAFAWDYAQATQQDSLRLLIESRARDFYLADQGASFAWEPSGFDFLSPALAEVDLMRRLLPEAEFHPWLSDFLPILTAPDFDLPVGQVRDRTDGKLVHLDGLNFSRAWALYGLAQQYPRYAQLRLLAHRHVNHSLPALFGDAYEGGHWLGSFAIYALLGHQ